MVLLYGKASKQKQKLGGEIESHIRILFCFFNFQLPLHLRKSDTLLSNFDDPLLLLGVVLWVFDHSKYV